MKKILLSLIIGLGILGTTGCSGNKAVFDFSYEFNYALIYENGTWEEYKIEQWDGYANGSVGLWLEDGRMIVTSLNNVVLIKK